LKEGGKEEGREDMERYFGMLGCGNEQYLMNGNLLNFEYNNRKLIVSKLYSNPNPINKHLATLINHQHSLKKQTPPNFSLLNLMH